MEIVLRGSASDLSSVLAELKQSQPKLDIALSPMTPEIPEPIAIIRFQGATPYREVGGIIYMAHVKRLNVAIAFRPPMCTGNQK
jgi:hypothetical protein